MLIIYMSIVLLSTIIGAVAGIGGGVIIKPLFDIFNFHDTSTISLYSSFVVLSMSTVSMIKLIKKKVNFNKKIIIAIVIGSVLGGISGQTLFSFMTESSKYSEDISLIQNVLLLITFVIILIYYVFKNKFSSYRVQNPLLIMLLGFTLGSISVFLGIGGGPLNILLLTLCFSYDQRESAVYSIAIIFFSQISKFITLIYKNSFHNYDMSIVPFLCITAVVGGYIGISLNRNISLKAIEKIYITTVVGLIFICVNIIYPL